MNYINIIDDFVYRLVISLMSTRVTAIMKFVSFIGSATTLITLSITFLLLLKNKRTASLILLNLTTVFLINRVLKIIIKRPRPSVLRLAVENGYSFPSGHAMVATGFYGFLIYLVLKNIKKSKTKYPLAIFLVLLILSIGVSRIYLGVHYFTDIFGGIVIGSIYLVLFIKYIFNRNNRKLIDDGGKNAEYIYNKEYNNLSIDN